MYNFHLILVLLALLAVGSQWGTQNNEREKNSSRYEKFHLDNLCVYR